MESIQCIDSHTGGESTRLAINPWAPHSSIVLLPRAYPTGWREMKAYLAALIAHAGRTTAACP